MLLMPPLGHWQGVSRTTTIPLRSLDYKRVVRQIRLAPKALRRGLVARFLRQLWRDEQGQDIAEYAVMLAVILVIVVGTIRLIGSNANNVFSSVGSSIQ